MPSGNKWAHSYTGGTEKSRWIRVIPGNITITTAGDKQRTTTGGVLRPLFAIETVSAINASFIFSQLSQRTKRRPGEKYESREGR